MTLAGVGILVGTLALTLFAIVWITGGFVIDAGPLHFSAHGLIPSIVLAAAAYGVAAAGGRLAFVNAAAALSRALERHAVAIAVVLAAGAAGTGVGYGTYVASGADSAGYLSQAQLLVEGRLSVPVPLARRVDWSEPEWSFTPLGYRPRAPGEVVPTYPPGLPLLMALGARVFGDAPFLIGPICGALMVLCAYCLGARTYSRTAGLVAGALMASSPLLLSQIVQQMSDIPAAAFWTVALLLALSNRAVAAGAVSGFAVLIRPSLLPVAGAVAVALLIRRSPSPLTGVRQHVARLMPFGVAMGPGVLALAWVQWQLYGRPLSSGHGTFSYLFALENILPNIRDYTIRIVTGETPALALVGAALLMLMLRPRDTIPVSSVNPVANPGHLALLVALPVLLCYLPYGVFPDWAYLRFFLPAWPAALAATGALIAHASLRLPAAVRAQVLVVAVAAVCARNVVTAANEGTFTLRIDASRYGSAGRYLDSVLPEDAVIVTSQESGSVHYYTHRPVLRWDLLNADLDHAVAHLTAAGHHVVLLVEDWEKPVLSQRFPASTLARLDWQPRAVFGGITLARLFDPGDRGRSSVPVDRIR